MMKRMITVTVMAVAIMVYGCGESDDITIHEMGKYKGEQDPLLTRNVSERSETLKQRFSLGQMDR